MKNFLLPLSLLLFSTILSRQGQAQKNTAFAITGEAKGNVNWTVIREIDLSNGALVRNIYLPATQKPLQLDATTGKTFLQPVSKPAVTIQCNCTAQSLAAASAYDNKLNRIYFTTLFGNDLQYIDMNQRQLKIYHVSSEQLRSFPTRPGEGDNITRMTFGADGFGYALTNNGNHLIRFSSEKNIAIKDLGSLKDDAKNGNTSVHTQSSSWGGDLIGDEAGNLYLFTVAGNVFKINPQTLNTNFLGIIKNLPEGFSVNAAAVNAAGLVTVSSSLDASDYYTVDLTDLSSAKVEKKDDNIFNASDFANGNLAYCGTNNNAVSLPDVSVVSKKSSLVTIYPNPVKNKAVNLYFHTGMNGKYMIELLDLNGKKITDKSFDVNAKTASQVLYLPQSTVAGMYMVYVLNSDGKKVHSSNIMVE